MFGLNGSAKAVESARVRIERENTVYGSKLVAATDCEPGELILAFGRATVGSQLSDHSDRHRDPRRERSPGVSKPFLPSEYDREYGRVDDTGVDANSGRRGAYVLLSLHRMGVEAAIHLPLQGATMHPPRRRNEAPADRYPRSLLHQSAHQGACSCGTTESRRLNRGALNPLRPPVPRLWNRPARSFAQLPLRRREAPVGST